MDNDKLKKGLSLSQKIDELKSELENWTDSKSIYCLEIQGERNNAGFRKQARTSFVNFEVIKSLTLSEIGKQLQQLEVEFGKL